MMKRIDIFPWDDNFATGLDAVDQQHKKLIDIINDIAVQFAFNPQAIDLSTIFNELIDYTHYHFSTEESIWLTYFPESEYLKKHQTTHASFIQTVTKLIQEQQGQPVECVAEHTLDFLVQWLVSHILEADRSMAYTVKAIQRGLSLKEAQNFAAEAMSGHTREMIDIVMSIYKVLSRNTLQLMRELTVHQKIKSTLEYKEELLQALVDQIPDVLVIKDDQGNFLLGNQAVARFYATTPEAMVGKNDADFGVPSDIALWMKENAIEIMKEGESHIIFEDSRDATTGEMRHFKAIKKPIKNAEGRDQLIVIAYDITEELATKKSLEQQKSFLKALIQRLPDLVWFKDPDGTFLMCNPRFEALLGLMEKNIVGKNDYDFVDKKMADSFRKNDQLSIEKKGPNINEEWVTFANDGHKELLETTKIPMFDENDSLIGVLGVARDITQQKTIEQQLYHIAHYDTLTNLPNRLLLTSLLETAIDQAHQNDSLLAIFYLDIDEFKTINDHYGHDVGNQILVIIARRLSTLFPKETLLARIGGDEFIAVVQHLNTKEEIQTILDGIVNLASKPVTIEHIHFTVSASIGITFYPQEDAVDADRLIRQSDQAMYQAKQLGKGRYHVFDPDFDRAVRIHHESLERIRTALENGEFVLFYQPKVNMRTGNVIGVEALIRWDHPEKGILLPGAFLPDIANTPLMIDLGDWVIEHAMQQIQSWHILGIHLQVSINVDSLQLQQHNFIHKLQQLLLRYNGVQKGDIEFEILETSALEDIALVADMIAQCQELGINFSLDDFGTGYSSLTYLKRLPTKILKIDQSFIFDLFDDPDNLAIIEGILELSDTFGRSVIAEGVESIVHGTLLLAMGCDQAQGYAIAKPMAASILEQWLKSWRRPKEWERQKPFSPSHLAFVYALVEHRAWIRQICSYLTQQTLTYPRIEMEQCRLGKWLHEQGREMIDSPKTYDMLLLLCHDLHHQAKNSINEFIKNRRTATTVIEHIKSLSDQIVQTLLNVMQSPS